MSLCIASFNIDDPYHAEDLKAETNPEERNKRELLWQARQAKIIGSMQCMVADILCLQELPKRSLNVFKANLSQYKIIQFSQQKHCKRKEEHHVCSAIFAKMHGEFCLKDSFELEHPLFYPEKDRFLIETRRAACAVIEINERDYLLANLHLKANRRFREKYFVNSEIKDYLQQIKKIEKRFAGIFLIGEFNQNIIQKSPHQEINFEYFAKLGYCLSTPPKKNVQKTSWCLYKQIEKSAQTSFQELSYRSDESLSKNPLKLFQFTSMAKSRENAFALLEEESA